MLWIRHKNTVIFLLVAAFLTLNAPAFGALSVGGEIGGNYTSNLTLHASTNSCNVKVPSETVDASFLLGLTVEYYFINRGLLAYDWPEWMKNLSFAMDFTHNSISFGHQPYNFMNNDPEWGSFKLPEFSGNVFTLSFLIKYRFPLTKSIDFPDGRLFWYTGIGPGITFSTIEGDNSVIGHGTSTTLTLVAETGFSLFIVKDVSVDLFFRYRYSVPRYEFNIKIDGPPLFLKFENNTFNGGLRIAYHF